ncbi:ester cyclase [Chelativorans sp.]|uniref:ester cyclase n=1 Tax=Chelativorans sp. TaxID=2203393 RepID=UPI0028124A6C|nr:ester cyclase [Chelativorans sp.]
MSTSANKELVRRLYAEVFSSGDVSGIESLVGADYVDHNSEGAGRGPQVLRAHVQAIRTTFPDFSLTVEDMIAEGDKVVTRVSGQGTHGGIWLDIPPTNTVVKVKGINIDRIKDGRIVEHWGEADTVGMLMQMGVDPFAGRGG